MLVQVGKQQLLLGVTANQVNTLHVLDGAGERNDGAVVRARPVRIFPSASEPPSLRPLLDFKAILKRSLGL